MAEQPENPYARLYGRSQDTLYNSMAGTQHHPSQHSQPQAWPQQSYVPWQSHPATQEANLQSPPWQAQNAPPAVRHPNVRPAAPPWLSAEPVHNQGIPQAQQPIHSRGIPQVQQPVHSQGIPQAQQPVHSQGTPQAQQHPAQGSPHPDHIGNSACQASGASHAPSTAPAFPGLLPASQQWIAQEIGDGFRQQPQKRPRMSSDTGDHDGNSSNRLHGIASTTPDSEHGLKADAGRQQEETNVVLIWDVDETLVLFLSLLDGSFARAFQQDPKEALELGERWQDAIEDLCDTELLFRQLEAVDQTHISSMAAYDDGLPFVQPSLPVNKPLALPVHDASRCLMAQAYRFIRQKYEKGLARLSQSECWPEDVALLRRLVEKTDAVSGRWISHAKRLLHDCQVRESNVQHVLVTTGQLIPTLAKLLICGLDALITAEDVYSSRNESKEHCFQLIQARYGAGAHYCVIGDGPEERKCADNRGWPFMQVCLAGSRQDRGAGRRLTEMTAEDILQRAWR